MNLDRNLAIVSVLLGLGGILLSIQSLPLGIAIAVLGVSLLLWAVWIHYHQPPYKDLYIGYRCSFRSSDTSVVTITRRTTFKVYGRHVTTIHPKFLSAVGTMTGFRVSLGTIAKVETAGGAVNLMVAFPEPLPVGSVHNIVIEYQCHGCYKNVTESFRYDGLKSLPLGDIEIDFHPEKLPVAVKKVEFRYGTRHELDLIHLNPELPTAYWLFRPKAGLSFEFEWTW